MSTVEAALVNKARDNECEIYTVYKAKGVEASNRNIQDLLGWPQPWYHLVPGIRQAVTRLAPKCYPKRREPLEFFCRTHPSRARLLWVVGDLGDDQDHCVEWPPLCHSEQRLLDHILRDASPYPRQRIDTFERFH